MPNDLENNDSIIKKIIIENNGTYDQANIGTSAEYVDYNNTSVADTLDNIQQQLARVIQQLTNNTEQITEMDETFGNARKVINKINLMQNQIEHLSQDIGDQVQKNINNTTFFTKDIIWQDNLERTLRSVLGNLINLPLQAINLRDWIEKISAMGGSGGGDANYENLAYVPLSHFGDITEDGDITEIFNLAIDSGYNIFLDIDSCKLAPGTYILKGSLLGRNTVIKPTTEQNLSNDEKAIFNFTTINNYELSSQDFKKNNNNIYIERIIFMRQVEFAHAPYNENAIIGIEKSSRPRISHFQSPLSIGVCTDDLNDIIENPYAITERNALNGDLDKIILQEHLQEVSELGEDSWYLDVQTEKILVNIQNVDNINIEACCILYGSMVLQKCRNFHINNCYFQSLNRSNLILIESGKYSSHITLGAGTEQQTLAQTDFITNRYEIIQSSSIKNCYMNCSDLYMFLIEHCNKIQIENCCGKADQFCRVINSSNISFNSCNCQCKQHNPISVGAENGLMGDNLSGQGNETKNIYFNNCNITISQESQGIGYNNHSEHIDGSQVSPIIFFSFIEGEEKISNNSSGNNSSGSNDNNSLGDSSSESNSGEGSSTNINIISKSSYTVDNIIFENCILNYPTGQEILYIICNNCSNVTFINSQINNATLLLDNSLNVTFANNKLNRLIILERAINTIIHNNIFDRPSSITTPYLYAQYLSGQSLSDGLQDYYGNIFTEPKYFNISNVMSYINLFGKEYKNLIKIFDNTFIPRNSFETNISENSMINIFPLCFFPRFCASSFNDMVNINNTSLNLTINLNIGDDFDYLDNVSNVNIGDITIDEDNATILLCPQIFNIFEEGVSASSMGASHCADEYKNIFKSNLTLDVNNICSYYRVFFDVDVYKIINISKGINNINGNILLSNGENSSLSFNTLDKIKLQMLLVPFLYNNQKLKYVDQLTYKVVQDEDYNNIKFLIPLIPIWEEIEPDSLVKANDSIIIG